MKEDVIAANLANLRQSVNELKETIGKLNETSSKKEQTIQTGVDERTVYNSVAKSFCKCWNDALSIVKTGQCALFKMGSQTDRSSQAEGQSYRLSLCSCMRLQHESYEH